MRNFCNSKSCRLVKKLVIDRQFCRSMFKVVVLCFFFSSRRRHTILVSDWSSDVCSSDLGTLDLMILKTLHALGPQHGFGIARRIEQVSRDVLQLNEGTVYTSLLRLLQQGWIAAEWGTSDNNRKAKFYSITARGQKQLAVETENWERISGVVGRVLRLEGER